MKFICHLLILACFSLLAFNAVGQEFRKIEGKILTADTKVPVPYAAIGLAGSGIGTICDEAGNFELKIPNTYKGKEICVSALGYKQTCLPPSGFQGANPTVFLEPANIELATVEIKALSATELVKEAIRRMPENYADKPVRYTFYQRQTEIVNNHPVYMIESVNEAYRNHPKKDHQLTIRKSRGMATSKKNREEMNDTWVSIYVILTYTDLSEYRPFLHPSKYKTYTYQLEDEEMIGNDTVYVISFKPNTKNNGKEIAGTIGKLYLHKRSKAIIRLESENNQAAIHADNNSLSSKAANKACKCTSEFQGANSTIIYKKIGNRWYLSNAYNEGKHKTTGEAYPMPEYSRGITQLVVTDIQTQNAREIPEEQRVHRFQNYYSTAPKDMNEAYWQQYNVLPLPDAFKKVQQLPN